jgi:hypothetical protein
MNVVEKPPFESAVKWFFSVVESNFTEIPVFAGAKPEPVTVTDVETIPLVGFMVTEGRVTKKLICA